MGWLTPPIHRMPALGAIELDEKQCSELDKKSLSVVPYTAKR